MTSLELNSKPFHALPINEALRELNSNAERGLTSQEVADRLQKFGYNELPKPEKETIWEKLKEQFSDLLVRILCLAAVISFVVSCFGKYPFRIFYSCISLFCNSLFPPIVLTMSFKFKIDLILRTRRRRTCCTWMGWAPSYLCYPRVERRCRYLSRLRRWKSYWGLERAPKYWCSCIERWSLDLNPEPRSGSRRYHSGIVIILAWVL